jgi:hypothetical protein
MMHQDDPATFRYDPSATRFCEAATRAYRTYRDATGSNFYVEKPNHDLLLAVATAVVVLALVVVVVWLRS